MASAGGYKYTLAKFIRDWMLIFCMIAGVALYAIYDATPALHAAGPVLRRICEGAQPVLLFIMLFLSFSKIEPSQMRPHKWMLWHLLVQGGLFIALALLLVFVPGLPFSYGFEALMLCLICPTATACVVITGKLGGNLASVVTYTLLSNLLGALLIPLFLPLVHPEAGSAFVDLFLRILGRVLPLLVLPCLLAWTVRYLLPKLHARIVAMADMAFYVWAVSLCIAILMSTRAVYHNHSGAEPLLEIAVASLLACAFQFWIGRRIGARYRCRISAAQTLGQKNTAFAIWLAYSFFTPVVSVAGGFYSIFQNCYNSWQLYRRRKDKDK